MKGVPVPANYDIGHGDVVIAGSSCTNTSIRVS